MGVVFVVIIPVLFVILALCFILRNIYAQQTRRAAFVLTEDPELAEQASHTTASHGSRQQTCPYS